MFTEPALCRDEPVEFFASAKTKAQISRGISICRRCPALNECAAYVKEIQEKHNRRAAENVGRDYEPNRDTYLQGVVAAQYHHATDGRGRKLQLQHLDRLSRKLFVSPHDGCDPDQPCSCKGTKRKSADSDGEADQG